MVHSIRDARVVVDVVVSVKIAVKLCHVTFNENVLNESSDERFISRRRGAVRGFCWPINHGVAARIGRVGFLLEIVPVLDSPSIFEAEYVDTDFGTAYFVVGVREDEITILKNSDGMSFGGIR